MGTISQVGLILKLKELAPGFAIVTRNHAVYRDYDQRLLIVKESCDEPMMARCWDELDAAAWLERYCCGFTEAEAASQHEIPNNRNLASSIYEAMQKMG